MTIPAHTRRILAALVALLCTAPMWSADASAQGNWVQLGPDSATIHAIAIDPRNSSVVYATGFFRGGFKSTDGGATWTRFSIWTGNVPAGPLAIDPATPSTIYTTLPTIGVVRSDNGGASWTLVTHGLTHVNVQALVIDPVTPAIVYAGTLGGGVFRSSDRGENWSAANTGLSTANVSALAIDPLAPTTLYAGTAGEGVFRTVDAGATWSPINSGLTSPYIQALAVDPHTPFTVYAATLSGVFKSANAGATWTAMNAGLAHLTVRSIAVSPHTPLVLYAGTDGGVFRSSNAGISWSQTITGLGSGMSRVVVFDPGDASVIYAGTERGVFRSPNNGTSWAASSSGMTGAFVRVLAGEPGDPFTLYAGSSGGGIYLSETGGASWTDVSEGLPSLYINSLALAPGQPSIVYAGTGDGLRRSTNRGASWTNVAFAGRPVYSVAVHRETPTTMYAATLDGIFQSVTGGTSWSTPSVGPPTTDIRAVVVHPQNPSIAYAGTVAGVFRTTDGGNTWHAVNEGLLHRVVAALVIDPQTPAILYAATDGGVYRTLNGGESWSVSLNGVFLTSLAIDPHAPTTVYGTGFSVIFRTLNSGATWTTLSLPVSGSWFSSVAVHPAPAAAGTLYAGPVGMSVLRWQLPPTASGVNPPAVLRGVPHEVTITGTSFVPVLRIQDVAGLTIADVQALSPTTARATITVGAEVADGVHALTVSTPHGSAGVSFNVVAPELSVAVSNPPRLGAGFDENYTITVHNVGSAATYEPVSVNMTLPPQLQFLAASGAGWACSVSDRLVTCVRESPLAPDEASTLSLMVAVEHSGEAVVIAPGIAVATAGTVPTTPATGAGTVIVLPTPVPQLRVAPLPMTPGQQASVRISLAAPFPHAMHGTLTLGFTPDPSIGIDDPAIQFATGGRTVSYVIEADSLDARFGDSAHAGPIGFQTGTVAGSFSFAGTLHAGRAQSTLSPPLNAEALTLPRRSPIVHHITTSTEAGFTAYILLSATSREVTQISLQFDGRRAVLPDCGSTPGCAVSGSTMTLDVSSLFAEWFANSPHLGSLSLLRLPFAYDGRIQGSVVIRLHNAHGVSNTATLPLP